MRPCDPTTATPTKLNIAEKVTLQLFTFFAIISRGPVTEKKGILVGAKEKGLRPSSGRDGRIYRLAVPSKLKIWSFQRRSYARAANKCTKKHDARAELLFCSLILLPFDVPVAVVVS